MGRRQPVQNCRFRSGSPCATTDALDNNNKPAFETRGGCLSMSRVKDQRDFWSGILFIAFGCAGLWVGRSYPVGTLVRMGPGFFPLMMCVALLGIGAFVLARSLVV